ncbi:MAG: M1 family metallopeptidase [Saprospiraceae bacterium]|nr:M1 family metallopeptidase [Saprospiraceae bacterium]
MTKLSTLSIIIAILFFSISCKTKKDIIYHAPEDDMQEELLDTLVITDVAANLDSLPKEIHGSATLNYDIIHTKLDLKFDWANQYVLGTADITFKPYFKPINNIILDAVGFEIHSVTSVISGKPYKYSYNGTQLNVELDHIYVKDEKAEILISYTAKPNENPTQGSEAITSNKGLFFIDPLENDPDLPTQIWSQGETENNSRWFPTFDKPNERFTQEIILTVDARYVTLSNGTKISSRLNADGTRTDHWKQDRPHAPYLAMIAVGEFEVVTDSLRGLPIYYYVEKGFGKYAKKIFNNTPEMLTFFSNKLGYPYPWEKYSQIVVREYVSGAMENSSAVVFGDFVQKTERELIDNDNDYIVAHEMMHHWFGDLVTCEDWSGLTLNEGFANYAEYLWFEYKYGKDRAEYHRMNDMNGYFSQVMSGGAHPLVNYSYDNKEQMFDAHSYNKGMLVLHMLRNYVGDNVFFESLNKYLKDNENTSVEVDELRMAFEDVSGEDLKWFFDQWYLGVGHPNLDIKYTYNDENKVLLVEVDQSNTPKGFYPIFKLPVDIAIYYPDGTVQYYPVTINEKKQRILIEDLKMKPATYVFDGKNVLFAMINENKTTEQYKAQFKLSSNFMDKTIAFSNTNDGNIDLIDLALNEGHYTFRSMAINAIPDSLVSSYVKKLQDMTLTDPHSEVRRDALLKLLNIEEFEPTSLCKLIMESEQSYTVLNVALQVLGSIDSEKAMSYFEKYKNEETDQLATTLVGLIPDEKTEYLEYLEKKAKTINLYYLFDFYEAYQEYLEGKGLTTVSRAADNFFNISSDKNGNMIRKYMAMSSLNKIAEDLKTRYDATPSEETGTVLVKIINYISQIANNETDPTLKDKYQGIK